MIATNAIDAASQSSGGRERIVAYGYNYKLHLKQPDAANFISGRFFNNATKVSQAFGGELKGIGFVAIVNVPQRRCLTNLRLSSAANVVDVIEVAVNYHYEGQSPLTTAQELSQQTVVQYDEFLQVLRQL